MISTFTTIAAVSMVAWIASGVSAAEPHHQRHHELPAAVEKWFRNGSGVQDLNINLL